MKTKAISITMPDEMYKEAQELAKKEKRTMSELLRETIRKYIEAKQGWEELAEYGKQRASELGIRPESVVSMVREGRRTYKINSKRDGKSGI